MRTFRSAVAANATAEALEGLSWAAWWLDDADTVFDARRRAYLRYKKDGAPAAAARVATWLACDQLDFRGAVSVATGWLLRAHRLLEPVEPPRRPAQALQSLGRGVRRHGAAKRPHRRLPATRAKVAPAAVQQRSSVVGHDTTFSRLR